jgi:hypothetical protein
MAHDDETYRPHDEPPHRHGPRHRPLPPPEEEDHGLSDVARRDAAENYGDRFGTGPRVRGFRGQNPPSDLGTARNPEPFYRGYRRAAGGPYGERYGDEDPRYLAAGFGDNNEDSPPAGRGRAQGYRGRGPKNYTRSDERIREDLSERLWEADDVDASEVTVEVENGVVTLGGAVEQRWTRHRIEDMADACSGVQDIQNDIRVQPGKP